MSTKRKLYAYVDETGQDTLGRFFLVVAVVVDEQRQQLIDNLEAAEFASGKLRPKWRSNRVEQRQRYLEQGFLGKQTPGTAYYRVFGAGKDYKQWTTDTVAAAITAYRGALQVGNEYEVTVVIDGLTKQESRHIAVQLRALGVQLRVARGIKDDNDAVIRLADAVAGMVRDAAEGGEVWRKVEAHLKRAERLVEL